jgi:hypothetical protein
MISKFEVGVVSDLFDAGCRDDGQPFIAERFFVELVNVSTGCRWRHNLTINGTKSEYCEETGDLYFSDLRADATARLERLVARVQQRLAEGGRLDADQWYEVDPVYGSDEYVSQGIELQRVFAERAAH